MALYDQGPLAQYNSLNAKVIPDDVFYVAINWFINRTPLLSRLQKLPTGAPQFQITNDNYRPRSVNLGAALTNNGTTMTVADNTIYGVGDVVQVDSEYMAITAIVNNATDVTITRAYAGTTGAAHNNNSIAYLVGRATSGNETGTKSISRIPSATVQYCQTVQHAYSVGGALQADSNYMSGATTPLDRDRMLAMQHVADDFETACYYGKGVSVSSSTAKPFMKGLQSLMATNVVTSPTNASAYKASDFVRDVLQGPVGNGGNPSVVLVSTEFMTGFAVWGHAALRLNAGQNVYGTPIDLFEAPFLSGVSIIPCPLLRPYTAIGLTEAEIRLRIKRAMLDKPRGSQGDAVEGDIILDGAIELDNEAHHSFVTGITAFSA